ncbi:Ribosomal RNA small subunit methyltransferase nep-1 [Sesamum angolense]|uniref:Ribosomal RNA small subunit methyltransferase nep-1 n=1 Tax=Sesamum angolense TaxID=2727404 RepID=A0AAE2BQY8_9LAMI|nr:Ribosomal RNA small subunit methyltransferase nep-1 [Sesamum angolense]
MGRSVWRRLTSYRRPRKLRRVSDNGEKSDMELRGREGNDDIVPGGMLEANSQQAPAYIREIGSLKSVEGVSFSFGNSRPIFPTRIRTRGCFCFRTGFSYQILNPDEHAGFMRKHNLDRRDYRPDIIHEVLKRLLGRPLSMSGRIQAVYVKTIQGYLIKIDPIVVVPPTLKLFCAMMSQLFQKLSIKGSGRHRNRKLLQMIQNPVTMHLPAGSHKIGLSSTSSKAVDLGEYFGTTGNDRTLVFVIGAMAHGKIDNDYMDDFVAVSSLPLSARACVSLICDALEWQQTIL